MVGPGEKTENDCAMSDTPAEAEPVRGQSVRGASALDSLPLRTRTTGEEALARSRLIRRLRLILPAFAGILVLAFIINTRTRGVDDAFLKDFESLNTATDEMRMLRPLFVGVDEEGTPYEISAATALQDPNNSTIVELNEPRAVQGGGEDGRTVLASRGTYDTEENILELHEGVSLEHKIGADKYILRAPSATVLIDDEMVVSNAGVNATGPDGATLKADTMKAYRTDGRVVFEGNVSMRLRPDSINTDLSTILPEDKE